MLLNVLSKDGNYPLMQAVTNDNLECAARLLQAGARIMVPVNHFEDSTVAPTSMLHEIIYSLAYLEDGASGGNAEDRLELATLLEVSFRILRASTAGLNKWASSCSEPSLVKVLPRPELDLKLSVSTAFPSSKLVAAHSRVGNTLCLCLPILPTQAVPQRGSKSSGIDFAVILFLNSLWVWLPHDLHGLKLGLKLRDLKSAAWPTEKVSSALTSQNNLCRLGV